MKSSEVSDLFARRRRSMKLAIGELAREGDSTSCSELVRGLVALCRRWHAREAMERLIRCVSILCSPDPSALLEPLAFELANAIEAIEEVALVSTSDGETVRLGKRPRSIVIILPRPVRRPAFSRDDIRLRTDLMRDSSDHIDAA